MSLFESDAEEPQILPLSCGEKDHSDDKEKRVENVSKDRAKIEHFPASICIHRRLFILYYLIVNKKQTKHRRPRTAVQEPRRKEKKRKTKGTAKRGKTKRENRQDKKQERQDGSRCQRKDKNLK